MSRLHGKPLSACHQAKLKKIINGEWVEWFCTAEGCSQPVHEDGTEYSYLVKGQSSGKATEKT